MAHGQRKALNRFNSYRIPYYSANKEKEEEIKKFILKKCAINISMDSDTTDIDLCFQRIRNLTSHGTDKEEIIDILSSDYDKDIIFLAYKAALILDSDKCPICNGTGVDPGFNGNFRCVACNGNG